MASRVSPRSSLLSASHFYRFTTPSFNRLSNELPIDHVAVRTFRKQGGIEAVREHVTQDNQYASGGTIDIPQKHLRAEWFYTNDQNLQQLAPRIFVSEIDETKLSDKVQCILTNYLTRPIKNRFKFDEYVTLHVPHTSEYQQILHESEYAAWTLLNGNRINHIALEVPDIYQTMYNLKNDGYPLNIGGDGSVVFSSSDNLLHQASIKSCMCKYLLRTERGHDLLELPGSFIEFIQRDIDECGNKKEGFELNNAIHIFNSTAINIPNFL